MPDQKTEKKKIWLISLPNFSTQNLSHINESLTDVKTMEYSISDIAEYLLSPRPISIEKKLVGYKIDYKTTLGKAILKAIKTVLPGSLKQLIKGDLSSSDTVFSPENEHEPTLKDSNLNAHFESLESLLKPYDRILNKLTERPVSMISDISGITEDVNKNRAALTIQGTIPEKINYVKTFLSQKVNVTINSSYIAEGVFEMSAYDFKSYNPESKHKLLNFFQDTNEYWVLVDENYKVKYQIKDTKFVHYLLLLDHLLKVCPKLKESLEKCANGEIKPLKLYFNNSLEIDYYKADIPTIYKEIFTKYEMGIDDRYTIIDSLRKSQFGVYINYVNKNKEEKDKITTNIVVLHDLEALEPIKNNYPQLYSEIDKKSFVSEGKKIYLLDLIKG